MNARKRSVSEDGGPMEIDPSIKRPRQTPPRRNPLKVISWNIDGLDCDLGVGDVATRAAALSDILVAEEADVVLLQEMLDLHVNLLKKTLSSKYSFHVQTDAQMEYFVCVLVHRERLRPLLVQTTNFDNSRMGRGMVAVKAECLSTGEQLVIGTAHLESLAESGHLRVEQLTECLTLCKSLVSGDTLCVFGGDLNLRDKEAHQVLQGSLADCADVWELAGRSRSNQYTWDLLLNDNKQFPNQTSKPRCRFDRLYISKTISTTVKIAEFRLLGTRRIPATGRFISDHFGVLTLIQ